MQWLCVYRDSGGLDGEMLTPHCLCPLASALGAQLPSQSHCEA